jgi:hypothetical protein
MLPFISGECAFFPFSQSNQKLCVFFPFSQSDPTPPLSEKQPTEDPIEDNHSVNRDQPNDSRNPYMIPKRVSGAYRTRGVGYNANYETLSTLITPGYKRGVGLPMMDLRVHHLDNGTYAGNFGLGLRFVPNFGCEIFGVNAYYDFRNTHRGNYNQFGLGLELLGKRWGLHFNGYLPVGRSKHGKKVVFDDFVGDFRAVCQRSEYAFDSFNLGLDFQIVHAGPFYLFGAVSPYYVCSTHRGQHSLGIKGGIRPQFGDYFAIDLNVTHDSVFGTILQGAAILTIPLYSFSSRKNQKGPCGLTNRQIYQPVQRDEIIKLKKSPCCFKTNF